MEKQGKVDQLIWLAITVSPRLPCHLFYRYTATLSFPDGPSLAIVAMYGPDEFRKLLRTGEPIGGRDIGEMGWVARNGFVNFTDHEIGDIRKFPRDHHAITDGAAHP